MNTLTNHSSVADRLMRQVIIPLVLMLGLYGLLRYAVTGDTHLPPGGQPAVEVVDETV